MGWLFKSKKERERERAKARRHAVRQAQNAIDGVRDTIRDMERRSTREWQEARDALKSGQKSVAQRKLIGYRASQVLALKLEQKRWVFEQYKIKMEAASIDADFADAMARMNRAIKIDPERVADVFETAQDILGDQIDTDAFWETLHARETAGAASTLEDRVPGIDELSRQLESEAATEIGGAGATDQISAELDKRIASGQERVKKLLDDKP